MKKARVLFRSGRFLIPATVILKEDGAVDVIFGPSVTESTRVKGSLSSREVSSIVPDRISFVLGEGECKFSVRKVRRRMEVLDRDERRMLGYLGIDFGGAIRDGKRFYGELYLVRMVNESREHTLVADRRTAVVLENYLTKYCTPLTPPGPEV